MEYKKNKIMRKYRSKKIRYSVFILVFIFSMIFINLYPVSNNDNEDNFNSDIYEYKRPKPSWKWATLNLTNPIGINDTGIPFPHGTDIIIKGRLYNKITGFGKPGVDVILVVDGEQDLRYTNSTDFNGDFQINYTIDPLLDVLSKHKIEVLATNGVPTSPSGAEIEYRNHYIIETNATSNFDIENKYLTMPYLAYQNNTKFDIPGYLKYDSSLAITNATIEYYWYNETSPIEKWPTYNFTTSLIDGTFNPITIPDDNISETLNLSLTYFGFSKYIDNSQKNISISLYRNITCVWTTVASATEGNQITIRGQIFARNISYLKINFTEVRLRMSGASIGTTFTIGDGTFELTYSIPGGIVGSNTIEVELLNYPNINSNNTHIINIAAAPVTPSDDINGGGDKTPPPFQNFFMVLIPIIIGIVAGFAIFGYFYLKKQKEESMLVKLPLESRIRNLKILKDTGRLEESLSYLFQSIYMELINGKYGRRIKENETIRDFAIISVRALNLNPSTIYPFIQKVEEIIYARPFIINDKDFYETVELFSPIYFELTGYNFVLNF